MVSGLPLFQHGSLAEARPVPSQLVVAVVAVPVMLLAALLPVLLMQLFLLLVLSGFQAQYALFEPLPAVTDPEPVSFVRPEALLSALSIE